MEGLAVYARASRVVGGAIRRHRSAHFARTGETAALSRPRAFTAAVCRAARAAATGGGARHHCGLRKAGFGQSGAVGSRTAVAAGGVRAAWNFAGACFLQPATGGAISAGET